MKNKFFYSVFALLTILFIIDSPCVKAESPALPFTFENVTIEYSPEGYMPEAKCEIEGISSLISYFAIDTVNSSPVSLPLTHPGTYQVFASFEGNEKYEKAELSAVVTIEPVKAKILTEYKTVAYSRLENPVSYTVTPSWAEEFLEISVEYYPIDSIDSYPSQKLSAPTDLGLYYTIFNVNSKTAGIVCENKYMIYEIAAYRGKKLSAEEKEASVPKDFKCTFQKLDTVYHEGKPVSVQYTLSPAAISGKILYKKIYSNGTFTEYTSEPPSEPGEYICGYFLGNTCIGKGDIFIDKKEVSIILENETVEFSPDGIIPSASCENKDVEIAFTAFVLDKNGNVTMEEVPVPIKKCGKYSVLAYPRDTEHFKRTYSYGYIEITPSTPEIKVTETEFTFDGNEKQIGIEVSPKNISYSAQYYEWEDRDSNIPLGSAPSRAGKYYVIITAYDTEGNYTPITQTAIMYIDEITQQEEHISHLEVFLWTALGFLLAGGITVSIIFALRAIKKKEHNFFFKI